MELGQKLKEARTRAGQSQDAVAKHIGVSRQSISNWENNRTYPDIGSLLKLSDLYDLSLDELLKDDAAIPAHFENLAARRKHTCQILLEVGTLLELFGLMLVGMEFSAAGFGLEILGTLLAFLAFAGHLRYFDHSPTEIRQGYTGLALLAICNLLLLIFPELHSDLLYRLLHLGSICLLWRSGVYGMFWKSPRVWVYLALTVAIPLLTLTLNLRNAGAFVEDHPFRYDYRVSQVLQGREEDAEGIRVNLSNVMGVQYRLNITEPDGEYKRLGECVYTEPLPGQTEKALWQLIPEDAPDTLYRIAIEADDSVTLACYSQDQLQYKWLLTRADTCHVSIRSTGKIVSKSPDWYPAGSPDPEPYLKSADVVQTATLTIHISGLETDTLPLLEEYHHGTQVESAKYTLIPGDRGSYTLDLATRYDSTEEYALYRIPFEDGEYRFTVTFGH